MTKKKQLKRARPFSIAERYLQDVFVLREKQIEDVYKLFKSLYKTKPTIKVDCIDGITHEFSDLKSLFSYQNSKTVKIKTLSISNDENRFRASIEEGLLNGIHYHIELPNDKIYDAQKKMETIIEGSHPWYKHLAKFDFTTAAVILLILALLIDSKWDLAKKPIFEGSSIDYAAGFLYLIILGFPILANLKEGFFNKSTFLLGQGKDRYKIAEAIRWTIIIPTFISFFIGGFYMWLGK